MAASARSRRVCPESFVPLATARRRGASKTVRSGIASCQPLKIPSTNGSRSSGRFPRAGTVRRCCPRSAIRTGQCGSSPPPKIAAGWRAGSPLQALCRFFHRSGFLPDLRSFNGYDGPKFLPISIRPFCLIGADAGHAPSWRACFVKQNEKRGTTPRFSERANPGAIPAECTSGSTAGVDRVRRLSFIAQMTAHMGMIEVKGQV